MLRSAGGQSGKGPRVKVPVSNSRTRASAASRSAVAPRSRALAAAGPGGSGTAPLGFRARDGTPAQFAKAVRRVHPRARRWATPPYLPGAGRYAPVVLGTPDALSA